VIEQILSALRLAGEHAEPFFWRTHGGAEVDLLLRLGPRVVPIEVKLGGPPRPGRGLVECMKDRSRSRREAVAWLGS
jgi:predicted AAA+ superfamily ATPase